MSAHTNGHVPRNKFVRPRKAGEKQQRAAVERQGNIMFWVTLAAAVLIIAVAGVYAILL